MMQLLSNHWQLAQFSDSLGRWGLSGGAENSRLSAHMWDDTWDLALRGGTFRAVCIFGIAVAVASLLLWTINLAKKWMEDEMSSWHFQEIIWPLIVVYLLANGGANLASFTKGLRAAINNLNQQVLELTVADMELDKSMSELADYTGAVAHIKAARDQCNTITEPEKLKTCLQEQKVKIDAMKAKFEQEHPGSKLGKVLQAISTEAQKSPGEMITNVTNAAKGAITNLVVSSVVSALLYAFQAAFQYLVEATMLVTALMGPLAVGASLLPFGAKPIYAWLTGMWSIGLVKLGYNIAAGLTAYTMVQHGGGDDLAKAFFFGLLSPVLAVTVAAGGGMAAFNGILAASVAVTGVGVKLSGKLVGGTASAASSRISSREG